MQEKVQRRSPSLRLDLAEEADEAVEKAKVLKLTSAPTCGGDRVQSGPWFISVEKVRLTSGVLTGSFSFTFLLILSIAFYQLTPQP